MALLRRNLTQEFAAAVFGVSQSTVHRRWRLLRPVIAEVLADFVPDPPSAAAAATVLVDGTICPTWNWRAYPELFSGKAGHAGINIQLAAHSDGRLLSVGRVPIPGSRHDAVAYAASGLAETLTGVHTLADLGYLGVAGIAVTPIRKPPRRQLSRADRHLNRTLARLRAPVESAVAQLKTWRILSAQGGCYRAPIDTFATTLHAIIALHFFSTL